MARPSRYPLQHEACGPDGDRVSEYESEDAAIKSISAKLGITSAESLRKWLRRAEVNDGVRPGQTSEELAEIRELKEEVPELRRANEMADSSGGRKELCELL